MSPPVIRIEREWVGFEDLGKGIQDLCSGLWLDMWWYQGVGQQLRLFRIRYGGLVTRTRDGSGVNLVRMTWKWVGFEAYVKSFQ